MPSENGKLHWHPAFQGAMKLVWRKNKHDLDIREEVPLGAMPNIMDMLIIVKKPGLKLTDPIGAGFRGTNILEFKSPSDAMNIDTVAKVIAYANQYKSLGQSVNERHFDDITITLLRATLPNNLLQTLEQEGATIAKQGAGVYHVQGMSLFSTRIIAYDALPESDDYMYLKSLTETIAPDFGKKLVDLNAVAQDEDDIRNIASVMHVTVEKHKELFKQILMGDNMGRFDCYKILFEDEFAQTEAMGEAKGEAGGEARGEARGKVLMAIGMGRDLGLSDDQIISHIATQVHCSQVEATNLFQQYGTAQQAAYA